MLTPFIVNNLEPVFWPIKRKFTSIDLGCSMKNVKSISHFQLNKFSRDYFCIFYDFKNNKANVLLHELSSEKNILFALLQIELVEFVATCNDINFFNNSNTFQMNELKKAIIENNHEKIEILSSSIIESGFDEFLLLSKQNNWSYDHTQFSPNMYRYTIQKYGNEKIDKIN